MLLQAGHLISRVGIGRVGVALQNLLALQVWMQEFVWLGKDHEGSLANRNQGVPTPEQAAELVREPMFCVETSVVAMYWSLLVYDYQEASCSHLENMRNSMDTLTAKISLLHYVKHPWLAPLCKL